MTQFKHLQRLNAVLSINHLRISSFKLIAILIAIISLINMTIPSLAQGSKREFFPKKDLMQIGVYYYPEQWPEDQWDRDLKRMAEMGFEFTHYGEFAWALMEPEEGKYDFRWLDKAVELAAKYNLKVIMCTPTPTPPIWLTKKHPEILMVDDKGRTMQHGSRQHISWSSPVYRTYVEKIVTELGKRYGKDKRVWGWQIDNEPSHYNANYDYSEAVQVNFRTWLQKKYRSIDELNRVWGNNFWSQKYSRFDQIRIPNKLELPAQPNPHAVLDFNRFTADEAASFISLQYRILRKYADDNQWITTNFMPLYSVVDPWRSNDLDLVTYTAYPVAGYNMGVGEQGFRISSPDILGFNNDFIRPITGTVGVMELQPGQVNWGSYNPQPLPGAVKLWIWHVFAGGNVLTCTYRFRQPNFSAEQYHNCIIGPDGTTPLRAGKEYITAIEEMKTLRKVYKPNSSPPEKYAARRTAILYSPDNRWEIDNQPQTDQWNFLGHLKKYHKIAKAFGAPVDVISDKFDFNKYPVLIAPSYQLISRELVEKWKQYVEQGGTLILTTRTGQKDMNAHLWVDAWAGPISSLIGGKISLYDHLPQNRVGKIGMGEKIYEWNNWADVLEADSGTEVIASYKDQFYKGGAAITIRRLGKGIVAYIGPDTDKEELEKDALRAIYKRSNIAIEDLPEGLVKEWRDGFWIAMNYSSTETYQAPVPENAKILVGDRTLEPADVVIWTE
jgi:beta-galactosidase